MKAPIIGDREIAPDGLDSGTGGDVVYVDDETMRRERSYGATLVGRDMMVLHYDDWRALSNAAKRDSWTPGFLVGVAVGLIPFIVALVT